MNVFRCVSILKNIVLEERVCREWRREKVWSKES